MSIRMVVFDMAGTTVKDEKYVATAFQNAFKKQNIDVTIDEVAPVMGYEKKLAIRMLLEKHDANVHDVDDPVIGKIYDDFIEEAVDFYENSPEVKPAEGAEEIFHDLKARSIVVALNTGFPRAIADVIVSRFQWIEKGLVDDYIASDEVLRGRPYTYMIEELMSRAGIDDPKQIAKVGDTSVDVEEGNNMGCVYNIAITTGAYNEEDLEACHPTHIVQDLREISSILV